MKNYTSQVPIERTISQIEKVLAKAGAVNVFKNYKNGEIESINFSLYDNISGKKVFIQLPANVEAVEAVLKQGLKKPRKESLTRIKEQAGRTAWRLMLDWVSVQMSLIEMNQVEALQVFLPYIWDGNRTFYSALKESKFKFLEGRKE